MTNIEKMRSQHQADQNCFALLSISRQLTFFDLYCAWVCILFDFKLRGNMLKTINAKSIHFKKTGQPLTRTSLLWSTWITFNFLFDAFSCVFMYNTFEKNFLTNRAHKCHRVNACLQPSNAIFYLEEGKGGLITYTYILKYISSITITLNTV